MRVAVMRARANTEADPGLMHGWAIMPASASLHPSPSLSQRHFANKFQDFKGRGENPKWANAHWLYRCREKWKGG